MDSTSLKNGKIKYVSCIMSPDIAKGVPANHLQVTVARHSSNKYCLKNCPATVTHKNYFSPRQYFYVSQYIV